MTVIKHNIAWFRFFFRLKWLPRKKIIRDFSLPPPLHTHSLSLFHSFYMFTHLCFLPITLSPSISFHLNFFSSFAPSHFFPPHSVLCTHTFGFTHTHTHMRSNKQLNFLFSDFTTWERFSCWQCLFGIAFVWKLRNSNFVVSVIL